MTNLNIEVLEVLKSGHSKSTIRVSADHCPSGQVETGQYKGRITQSIMQPDSSYVLTIEHTVPCKVCGKATRYMSTSLCDDCWGGVNGIARFDEGQLRRALHAANTDAAKAVLS